jgi:hypothetical protein
MAAGNSSATKVLDHKDYSIILLMPFLLLTWQLNKPSDIAPLVIPAQAGIQ